MINSFTIFTIRSIHNKAWDKWKKVECLVFVGFVAQLIDVHGSLIISIFHAWTIMWTTFRRTEMNILAQTTAFKCMINGLITANA